MKNGRCRMHGGLSTGPKTLQGVRRIRAARTRHGRFSLENLALERMRRHYFANGYRSLAALGRGRVMGNDAQSYFRQILREEEALGSAHPKFKEWQRVAREAIEHRDVERLRAKRWR
jgi:hypothetical protein